MNQTWRFPSQVISSSCEAARLGVDLLHCNLTSNVMISSSQLALEKVNQVVLEPCLVAGDLRCYFNNIT